MKIIILKMTGNSVRCQHGTTNIFGPKMKIENPAHGNHFYDPNDDINMSEHFGSHLRASYSALNIA